ncbi:MAG: sulfatase-like hydrolase/transferase [Kiritimatiellia bacterium]
MHRPGIRLWILIVVLAAVCVGVVAALGLWSRKPRLNVLLITLDTTRADRLGCYGYSAARTPALDRLAREGLRFARAYTHCPLTLPAHATILTGLLPPEHGLRNNGRGKLAASVPTLAEKFRRQGYRTAAFVASFVLDRRFGLDRGFELYDDRMTISTNPENVFKQENRADMVCDRALAWLERNARRPFFCWVHFYDPHEPYVPPQPFATELRDPYDGEIAFMDSQIRRLLDFLDKRDLAERTLVIACGDHGEAFGEHGETGHGMLIYEEVMRVPLLLRLRGRIAPGIDQSVARLLDLPTTIAAILGWREAMGNEGVNLLAGEKRPEYSYGETLSPYYTYRWSPLHSLTSSRWKYIAAPTPELYDLDADPREQYNLTGTNEVSAYSSGEIAAVQSDMAKRLARLRSALRPAKPESVKLDHAALTKLRSLGYAAGSPSTSLPTADQEAQNLRDPKTVLAVHEVVRQAATLMDERKFSQAAELLEPVVKKSPESPNLHERLAEAYLRLGDHAQARPHVEAVLAVDPENRPMVINLADILATAGELEQAVAIYGRALTLPTDPREPLSSSGVSVMEIKARVNCGVALTKLNRLEEAAEQYRRVLQSEPHHVEANNNLGNVYVLLKRKDLAIEQYRKTLKVAPHILNARYNLGRLLRESGQYAAALAVWRDGLPLHPDDPFLLLELAWWSATCPEATCRSPTDALSYARRLCEVVGENAQAFDVLAAACASVGDFSNAVHHAERALRIASSAPEGTELAREVEQRLKLYRSRQPFYQRQ